MRVALVIAVIVLAYVAWINLDPQVKHMVTAEMKYVKHTTLVKTCPPSDGSTSCRVIGWLLYDP